LTVSGHGHPYVRARWKAGKALRHQASPTSQTGDPLAVPVWQRT
jgi:hypothetical protein